MCDLMWFDGCDGMNGFLRDMGFLREAGTPWLPRACRYHATTVLWRRNTWIWRKCIRFQNRLHTPAKCGHLAKSQMFSRRSLISQTQVHVCLFAWVCVGRDWTVADSGLRALLMGEHSITGPGVAGGCFWLCPYATSPPPLPLRIGQKWLPPPKTLDIIHCYGPPLNALRGHTSRMTPTGWEEAVLNDQSRVQDLARRASGSIK